MEVDSKIRHCYTVDWFDNHAQLNRTYELLYYPSDSSVEMYDVKQRRTFLKRMKSDITLTDLFLGATVNVNSRQLVIRDYGDEFTRRTLEKELGSLVLSIGHEELKKMGLAIDGLQKAGFKLCRMRLVPQSSQLSVIIEVLAPAVQQAVAEFMKTCEVKLSIVDSSLFESNFRNAKLANCTVCLIKPHAVTEGNVGRILQDILDAGYNVTDLEMFHLDQTNAEEFLEIYRGVLPEYNVMIINQLILSQLTAGPFLALEIVGEDIVNRFREFAGPMDPAIGKLIQPESIRAKYGIDKVKNAVHCTDLEEDGPLEVNKSKQAEYFFSLQ